MAQSVSCKDRGGLSRSSAALYSSVHLTLRELSKAWVKTCTPCSSWRNCDLISVCRSDKRKRRRKSKHLMSPTNCWSLHFSRRLQSIAARFSSKLSFCATALLKIMLQRHFKASTITGNSETLSKGSSAVSSFASLMRICMFLFVVTGTKTFLSLERIRRASKQATWHEVFVSFSRMFRIPSHSFYANTRQTKKEQF